MEVHQVEVRLWRRDDNKMILEERIQRFLMVQLRKVKDKSITAFRLRGLVRYHMCIRLSDKEIRGILRRMQLAGKPVVSTGQGFALCRNKKQIVSMAMRLFLHGLAEIKYARALGGSDLAERMRGQGKLAIGR